ncbi:MAG: murein biosynthesis integral membrane protein MurJ [Alphaproteobacteria bacterium]|nr:murein biosynthesis integral membrane protein MurJ [Alphaproteobacteria bacterium]MBV8549260.1 murein biosynthesis integral membrane protein MurJ [Alphaproteobacteria bacterium]
MSFFRSVATVGLFTLLSRAVGFLRDMLTAALIGAGPVADAFVIAQRLPNMFRMFFAEGATDTALVPIYSRKVRHEGKAVAGQFASQILTLLILILLPLVVCGIIFMPHVINLMAPGFVAADERYALAVRYSVVTFGYLLLVSVAAIQGSMLNANGHVGSYAFSPIILNVVLCVGLVLAYAVHQDIGLFGCWSLIIGGGIQIAGLWRDCRRLRVPLGLAMPRWSADVRHFFKLVGPGVIATGAGQINNIVSTLLASTLSSGAVAALYYADRVTQVPLGIVGGAIATALLPALSHHIAANEHDMTKKHFSRAVELALFLTLPLCALFVLQGDVIIKLLFERGAFHETDTVATASALGAYALAIPASILIRVFSIRFFAHHDTRTPVWTALASIAVNALLAIQLKSLWQQAGIAAAASAALWVNAFLLVGVLAVKRQLNFDRHALHRLPRIVFASGIMAFTIFVLSHINTYAMGPYWPQGYARKIAAFLLTAACSASVYLAIIFMTGVMRWSDLRRYLRNPSPQDPETF